MSRFLSDQSANSSIHLKHNFMKFLSHLHISVIFFVYLGVYFFITYVIFLFRSGPKNRIHSGKYNCFISFGDLDLFFWFFCLGFYVYQSVYYLKTWVKKRQICLVYYSYSNTTFVNWSFWRHLWSLMSTVLLWVTYSMKCFICFYFFLFCFTCTGKLFVLDLIWRVLLPRVVPSRFLKFSKYQECIFVCFVLFSRHLTMYLIHKVTCTRPCPVLLNCATWTDVHVCWNQRCL